VNVDPEIAGGTHAFLGGREQRGRKRFEQGLALDSALPLHVIQHCCYFRVHKTSSPQTKRSGTSFPTPSSGGLGAEVTLATGYRQGEELNAARKPSSIALSREILASQHINSDSSLGAPLPSG